MRERERNKEERERKRKIERERNKEEREREGKSRVASTLVKKFNNLPISFLSKRRFSPFLAYFPHFTCFYFMFFFLFIF